MQKWKSFTAIDISKLAFISVLFFSASEEAGSFGIAIEGKFLKEAEFTRTRKLKELKLI